MSKSADRFNKVQTHEISHEAMMKIWTGKACQCTRERIKIGSVWVDGNKQHGPDCHLFLTPEPEPEISAGDPAAMTEFLGR